MQGNGKISSEPQMQVAVGALLEAVGDKSKVVSETVTSSIRKLAKSHPNQILISCCNFCKRSTKTNHDHFAAVLDIMRQICLDQIMDLDGDTVLIVIDYCLQVMTESASVEPLIQMPACEVLVAIGQKHHIQVLDNLLKKLEAGVIPHYMIPHSLGALASSNAYGVIPYLKNILSILLPLMGGVKTDPLRQAFSYALGCFCDALVEYVSNLDQVPDNTITIESFDIEVGMAYDVLVASWLQSREPKVLESILISLSAMFPVLSVEKVNSHTPKMIQSLLYLYKKHTDPYYVTKCLGSVVQKAASVNGTLLEPVITNILHSLSDFVCVNPDYAQPELLRSHSEVLRCYECFARHFTDHTIDNLISQLKNNNEKERVKGLLVITHLISYSPEQTINRRYKDIMKYLNEMLNENSIRIRRALLKIIVAFCNKGILLDKEINQDGPDKYMEFILRLCCKKATNKSNEVESQEIFDLQKSADNTLVMLSTSIVLLEETLCNFLLDSFLGPYYDEAVVVILRCLTHLSSRRSMIDNYEGAFIRCLSLLAVPLPGFRGTYILNFLKNIKPCESNSYTPVWELKIPQLLKYLEQSYDSFNQLEWQDLLCDFLDLLLRSVKSEEFYEKLILKSKIQLDIYSNVRYSSNGSGDMSVKNIEKQFLLKCVAMIACYTSKNELVMQTLDNILSQNTFSTEYGELNACAEAIGICARTHLEIVLSKLSSIKKEVLQKRSSKLFSFIKDQKHEISVEKIRYVVICSYAEVCNEAPSDSLLKIIESEVLDFIINELNNCKDFSIRRACLKAIGCVADAMHPSRNTLHIRLRQRDKVIGLVSSEIHLHSGSDYIELFPVIIPVLTSLVRLPPVLESEQQFNLLDLCFNKVFNASAIYCKINEENESYYGDLKLVPIITSSFTKIGLLVQEVLLQSTSPATLDEVVTLLEPWLKLKRAEQRLPATETLRIALQTYLDNMKFAYDGPSTFGQTGWLLSRIVPRCTDPNKNIRKVAVEALCLVLCIASRYEGHMRDHDKQLTNLFQPIQQQIESEEPKLLYNLTSDLAHNVCLNIPQFQLYHYIDGLIDGLIDCEPSSANGTAVVLYITLKNKGVELQTHVTSLLEKLLVQLDKIQCPRTKATSFRSILSLGMHHSKIVAGILLSQPLPYEPSICDCWAILSSDPTLALDLLDYMKKVIKQTQAYEEEDNGRIKVANLPPLQAICALHEILKNTQLREVCLSQFPDLFTVLLVSVASYIGASSPVIKGKTNGYGAILNRNAYKLKPAKVALDTLRLFLQCCDYTKMSTSLLAFPNIDSDEHYTMFLGMVSNLVDNLYLENPESFSWMVACLGPYIRAELEPQRIAVVSFFTCMLKRKVNDQAVLAENLLEMILDIQLDQSCFVRKIGLQGLGYAAETLNTELIARHCNNILSVLMSSLDYNNIGNESGVILEGMLSFSKVLRTLEGQKFSNCQVTAAVRIKPLLSQEDVQLRRASIRLLGDLTQSLSPDCNLEAFTEQIQGNFITLLLHLCDPDRDVVKGCKYTLRKVSPYLKSPKVNAMIQEHLIDEGNLHYVNFIRDLIKIMTEEMQDLFPLLVMTTLTYLKSPWVEIRSHAALLVGLLYSQSSPDSKTQVSLDTVCDRLMRLLADENEQVRMQTVQAVAYLFL